MGSSRWSTGIFHIRENQRKSVSPKICNFDVCNAWCCATRINIRANHAARMQINRQLQFVEWAAPDGAQEFFISEKIKENRFLRKFAISTFATHGAVQHAS